MALPVEQWDPSDAEIVWLRDVMEYVPEAEEQALRAALGPGHTKRFGLFKKPILAAGDVKALKAVQSFRSNVAAALEFELPADIQVKIHEAENEMGALFTALQADPENPEVFRRIIRLGAAMSETLYQVRTSYVNTIPKALGENG